MKSFIFIILLAFLMSINYSCATIFSGTATKVEVSGVQENAKVYYNGNYEGEAPLKVKVSKNSLKNGADITIKKEGYEDAIIKLVRKTKVGAIIGNVLFTGGTGLIIDFATGAIYKPHPDKVKYNLTEN
jgi:hypothetical protein